MVTDDLAEVTPEELGELQKTETVGEKITYVRAYRKFLKLYYDVHTGMCPYWIRKALRDLHPRDVIKVTENEIIPLGRKIAKGVTW